METDEKAKASSADLIAQVRAGVAKIHDSQAWKDQLDAQARFWNYSFGNQLLIAFQKRNATRVAGFNTWKELGRYVKKGERGIRILAPLIVKGKDKAGEPDGTKKLAGFRVVSVFDISQTDGKPLPETYRPLEGESPAWKFDALKDYIQGQGFTVEFGETSPGVAGYVNREKKIVLRAGDSQAMALKVLAHEASHAMLGHLEDKDKSRELKELEAETSAWIISRALGLESDETSFAYLASWSAGPERDALLEKAGKRAAEVAKGIIAALMPKAKAMENAVAA